MEERQSLHLQAVEGIKNIIVRQNILPNHRLPSEDQLANQLGFSRTVIREAVKHLAARGILEVRQGQGTFVVEPPLTVSQEELSLLVQWDRDWLHELLEFRAVLELGIAELVIERITEDELARMSASILQARRRLERGELDISDEDYEFHLAYVEGAHNRAIASHSTLLRQYFNTPKFRLRPPTREALEVSIAEHVAIHQSILLGDAERLKEVLRVHLRRSITSNRQESPSEAVGSKDSLPDS